MCGVKPFPQPQCRRCPAPCLLVAGLLMPRGSQANNVACFTRTPAAPCAPLGTHSAPGSHTTLGGGPARATPLPASSGRSLCCRRSGLALERLQPLLDLVWQLVLLVSPCFWHGPLAAGACGRGQGRAGGTGSGGWGWACGGGGGAAGRAGQGRRLALAALAWVASRGRLQAARATPRSPRCGPRPLRAPGSAAPGSSPCPHVVRLASSPPPSPSSSRGVFHLQGVEAATHKQGGSVEAPRARGFDAASRGARAVRQCA